MRLESPRKKRMISTRRDCLSPAVLLVAPLLASAAAGAAAQTAEAPATALPTGVAADLADESGRFAFYVPPGLGLHHFLYQWARNEGRLPRDRSPLPEMTERAELEALADTERAAVSEALEVYRRQALSHDLVFDPEIVALGHSLAESEDFLDCGDGELAARLEPALRLAWPVYERRWWPEHRRRGREWVEAFTPLLDRYEKDATALLAGAWGADWPDARVPVEVMAYANWAGAYTISDPARIHLAASDPRLAGIAAVEALLHEVSHIEVFERAVHGALDSAFEAADVPVPRDLWHVMIFYVAGDTMRRVLAADGEPGYVPYGERSGLYDRLRGWRDHARALESHWQPFLDGGTERAVALGALAESYRKEAAPEQRPLRALASER